MSDKSTLITDSTARVALELMEKLLTSLKEHPRKGDPLFLAGLYEACLALVIGGSVESCKIDQLLKQ